MRLNIRKIREERGFTLEEVAEFMSLSVPTIQRWESGTRNPGANDLEKLADCLHCGPGDFFGPKKRAFTKREELWALFDSASEQGQKLVWDILAAVPQAKKPRKKRAKRSEK